MISCPYVNGALPFRLQTRRRTPNRFNATFKQCFHQFLTKSKPYSRAYSLMRKWVLLEVGTDDPQKLLSLEAATLLKVVTSALGILLKVPQGIKRLMVR